VKQSATARRIQEENYSYMAWAVLVTLVLGAVLSLGWISGANTFFVATVYVLAVIFQTQIFGQKHFDENHFGEKDPRELQKKGVYAYGHWVDVNPETLSENMKLIQLSRIAYQRLLLLAQILVLGGYFYLTLYTRQMEFQFGSLLHLSAAIYLMLTTHKGHFFLALFANFSSVLLALRNNSGAPPAVMWGASLYSVLLIHALVALHDFDLKKVFLENQSRWQSGTARIFQKTQTVTMSFAILIMLSGGLWKWMTSNKDQPTRFQDTALAKKLQSYSKQMIPSPDDIMDSLENNLPMGQGLDQNSAAETLSQLQDSLKTLPGGTASSPSDEDQQALKELSEKLGGLGKGPASASASTHGNSTAPITKNHRDAAKIREVLKNFGSQPYQKTLSEIEKIRSHSKPGPGLQSNSQEIEKLAESLKNAAPSSDATPQGSPHDSEIADDMADLANNVEKHPVDEKLSAAEENEDEDIENAVRLRKIMSEVGKKPHLETLKELQNLKKETVGGSPNRPVNIDPDNPELDDYLKKYTSQAEKLANMGGTPAHESAAPDADAPAVPKVDSPMIQNELKNFAEKVKDPELKKQAEALLKGMTQNPTSRKAETPVTKKEFKVPEALKKFLPVLLFLLAAFLLSKIFQTLKKPTDDDEDDLELEVEIGADEFQQLLNEFQKIRRQNISPNEAIIRSFQLALELMSRLNVPKPDGLPVEDFPARFPKVLKAGMVRPFSSITNIFGDCFYGRIVVGRKDFDSFTQELEQIFREANKFKVRVVGYTKDKEAS
jgi:hypothetical protein